MAETQQAPVILTCPSTLSFGGPHIPGGAAGCLRLLPGLMLFLTLCFVGLQPLWILTLLASGLMCQRALLTFFFLTILVLQ